MEITGLSQKVRYTVRTQALEKWAAERLKLEREPDRGWVARFYYEGTTCSNLGRPLYFEYVVRLSPGVGGYRIQSMECSPGHGRTGYESMCAYLRDSESLMQEIRSEKPLLGRCLEDILAWDRPFNPAGCYCEATAREHKWGLVLEVIHFAISRMEAQESAIPVVRAV